MLTIILSFILAFLFSVLFAATVGVTWTGTLIRKDQLFAWTVPYIKRIPIKFFRSLLTCHKCVAGQFSLWLYVVGMISLGIPFHVMLLFLGVMYILAVILVADLIYKWGKFDDTPAASSEFPQKENDTIMDRMKKYMYADKLDKITIAAWENMRAEKLKMLTMDGTITKPLEYFQYNSKFSVRAIFIPSSGVTAELTFSDGSIREETVAGRLEFEIDQYRQQLTAYQHPTELFVPFVDTASGVSAKGRYLNVPIREKGDYILNFNFAYNPLCEYQEGKYSCPLVPPQNHLAVAIEAGEKAYQ